MAVPRQLTFAAMRILMVGAGGIGGYFGARLIDAGRDVTFLVRPRRAAQLAERGLVIDSPARGNTHIRNPKTVQADSLRETYDLVMLSCKAYDLDDAMTSLAPAVGPTTAILPLLNGMAHVDALVARFGDERVLGGHCFIASTLADNGDIRHLNANHTLVFGDRHRAETGRIAAIEAQLTNAGFDARRSDDIVQEMWEKWVFIATGAGLTSLMRGSVGEIEAAGGAPLAKALLDDCAAIARDAGHPPSDASYEKSLKTVTAPGSTLTASMFRDIERGGRTEGEHILGDLLRRAKHELPPASLLRAAYTHVATYEVRRG